jgi:uncharacterized protein
MQVNLDHDLSSYMIRSYNPSAITISIPSALSDRNTSPGQSSTEAPRPVELKEVQGSLIISPRHLIRDWPPMNIDGLQEEHLDALVELQPELILLGTGPRLQFPETKILASLHNRQIGVEVMDTAAACRTYNILMTEGRFVVAGLINQC